VCNCFGNCSRRLKLAQQLELQNLQIVECKKGSLVISRHNETRDEVSDLASKALSPSAVRRDEPKIHTCCIPEVKSDEENKENSAERLFRKNRNEDRGDILIRGLWSRGTASLMFRLRMSMLIPIGLRHGQSVSSP
jgi:hypothetical protein